MAGFRRYTSTGPGKQNPKELLIPLGMGSLGNDKIFRLGLTMGLVRKHLRFLSMFAAS